MGRKFARVSLGGVHDEAEIRGHRRTYIGALPGNIIQAIRKAGARDCVMMLDEIDKMGARHPRRPVGGAARGARSRSRTRRSATTISTCRSTFSRVVFITTANMLDTIPGPLRDRMEIIQLASYTAGEKMEIAKRYLVRRQLEANGLKAEQVEIEDAALRRIIDGYTREAGVRSLEREIGRVLRHVAVEFAEGATGKKRDRRRRIEEILGPVRFENEVAMRSSVPGVATGLAWTPVGGDILFIEATRTPGSGRLNLTGQLGDVMKESAQAALTLVKSTARASRSIRRCWRRATSTCTSRPARRPRTGRAPAWRCSWRFLAADRPGDPQRHRHDRRDQPARAGAAGRRHQGEGRRPRLPRASSA